MSAKYSAIFLILSASIVILAVAIWEVVGYLAILFLYAALSFLLVAIAYGGIGPAIFLKRLDGRQHPFSWILLGPYLLLNHFAFWLSQRNNKAPPFAEAAPNLFFGRRLTSRDDHEIRAMGSVAVLDLACEFAEIRALREVEHYWSMPLLDATAPSQEQLQVITKWIRERLAVGPVYVHCGLGHGRSATVVLAYLLSVGGISTVSEGLKFLRSLRPAVGLNRQQLRVARQFESSRIRGG
ncbi:MAG: dual specificity protein phosphatase family protein [Gemmataceae bacterium]